MAKRVLVPVDHLPASALLDLVGDAARGGGATIRLIHVAPSPENLIGTDGRVMAYADQEGARRAAEALDMLHPIELHFGGVPVESVVRFGDPATEILREAEAFHADLIVMPTRARTGVTRLLFGSVTEAVARRAPMAVALVQPHTGP
jgi:nucleotide-binding universal stress UspA family protein